MKIDLPQNQVEQIYIAAVIEEGTGEETDWQVYFINEKDIPVQNVMISSKGYGIHQDREVQTSTLRHFIGDVDAKDFARVEPIDRQVFGLTNEYWVSFYASGVMYDKKFLFTPGVIQEQEVFDISILDRKGILAK